MIRPVGRPLRRLPGGALLFADLAVVAITVVLPNAPAETLLRPIPLSLLLLGVIAALTATYLALVAGVKILVLPFPPGGMLYFEASA